MSNSRDSSRVTTYTAKFDITSQIDHINQLKAGVEWVLTDNNIDYASVDAFLPAGGRYWVKYHTWPKRGGAYVQDKLEFEGMIANLGIRLDYLDPSGTWYSYTDPYNPAFSGTYSGGIDTLIRAGAHEETGRYQPPPGDRIPDQRKREAVFQLRPHAFSPRA